MSVTRRGDGWQGRVWADGRRISKQFPSKGEALAWEARVLADVQRGEWVDPRSGTVTVGAWMERWLGSRSDVATSTAVRYRQTLTHLAPISRKPVAQLTSLDVRNLGAQLLRQMSPGSARKVLAVLHAGLEAAAADRLIGRNPCSGVGLPRVSREEMRVLSPAQVDAAASHLSPSLSLLVRTAAQTGLRQGELLALEVVDVDPLRRRLWVSKSTGRYGTGQTKTGRSRTVPVPPSLSLELASFVAGRSGLVWQTKRGLHLNPSNVRRAWARALTAAGLDPDVRFHDLRHTCASILLSSGVDVVRVSKVLGHASPTTTLSTYAHLMPDSLDHAADRMEQAWTATVAPVTPMTGTDCG